MLYFKNGRLFMSKISLIIPNGCYIRTENPIDPGLDAVELYSPDKSTDICIYLTEERQELKKCLKWEYESFLEGRRPQKSAFFEEKCGGLAGEAFFLLLKEPCGIYYALFPIKPPLYLCVEAETGKDPELLKDSPYIRQILDSIRKEA